MTAPKLINDDDENEYVDDRAVFLIEDGERHWYVATDHAKALAEHLSLMEAAGDDEFTVTRQPDGSDDFHASPAGRPRQWLMM